MAPTVLHRPSKPFDTNTMRTGKQTRVEDDPEDRILGGRSSEASGSRASSRGESRQGSHPQDGGRHSVHQQPDRAHHDHSRKHGHSNQQPVRHHRLEQKHQQNGQDHAHKQSSAPGAGATTHIPGMPLHTAAHPSMSLGYAQGFLPFPTLVPNPSGTGATANQPSNGNTQQQQPFPQGPNFGVNPLNTGTYIDPGNMTYYRGIHDYQRAGPHHPQGLHFQPPVPDTTHGPMTHLYVPRHDNVGVNGQPLPGGPAQVPLQPQYVVGQNPNVTVHHQTPYPVARPQYSGQPAFNNGQAMRGTRFTQPAYAPAAYGAAPGFAGVPGSVTAHLPPDVTGVGKTISEIQAHHREVAMANQALEPEDFQPASTDPGKMYYCRELDGNWTLRSRYTIDNMGDWRWFQTPDGIFYAVRLPS